MEYEEYRKTLKELKITMKEFSILTNTSYLTVRNWGKDGRAVPNWVKAWLNLYIKNKTLEAKIKELENEDCEEYKALAKALQDVISKEKSQKS